MFGVVHKVAVKRKMEGVYYNNCGVMPSRYFNSFSIRAWRGLRYNEKYAAKLEKKLAKQQEQKKAKTEAAAAEEASKTSPKPNPFSVRAQRTGHSFFFVCACTRHAAG